MRIPRNEHEAAPVDTFNHEVWNDTEETRVVLFVDVLRPLPEPESTINRWIVKAIGWSPFVLDAKRNQEAWEGRYREPRSLDTASWLSVDSESGGS